MRAPVPATPAMAKSPSTRARPPSHGKAGVDHLPGVGLVDAHQRLAVARPHDPLIDRERPHRRGEVAAIAGPVGHRLVHGQLHERVVDIRVGPRRRPDDHRLGQGGDAPAHAVELAAVGVRAAEHGEQQLAARLPVRRQVAAVKEHALAGAAAIEPCGDPNLAHSCRAFLLVERLTRSRIACPVIRAEARCPIPRTT